LTLPEIKLRLLLCVTAPHAFKAPNRIVLVDALPKIELGKLDRRSLADRWTRDAVD
jgi:non-ribosomal peptide synthetase component E (peptide arylation enzyme)